MVSLHKSCKHCEIIMSSTTWSGSKAGPGACGMGLLVVLLHSSARCAMCALRHPSQPGWYLRIVI